MTAPDPAVGAPASTDSGTGWGRLRGLGADIRPLREHPPYRRLWAGQVVSVVGTQLTAVAVPLQIYALTRSTLLVGMAGLAALVPIVAFGLYGGAIADAADRRVVLLVTTSGSAAASAVLTAQAAAGHPHLAVLYGCVAWQAAFVSVDNPTRQAVLPRLVGRPLLPAANALSQVVWNLGLVTGPLLAGLLVGTVGYAWAYGFDTVSFGAALWSVYRLPPLPPERGGTPAGPRAVLDGLRYLAGQRLVLVGFAADLAAMGFGLPRALFPALAVHHFRGGAGVAGLLYAAPAVGALLAAVGSGWVGGVRRHGRAVLLAVALWGLSIAAFGVVPWLAAGLVLLAVAGGADMVSAVFRATIVQTVSPDGMLGRLGGVNTVVVTGGPRLGDIQSGTLASLVGTETAVVAGGLACVAVVGALAVAAPSFRRYDARRAGQPDPAAEGQAASTSATSLRSSTKPV